MKEYAKTDQLSIAPAYFRGNFAAGVGPLNDQVFMKRRDTIFYLYSNMGGFKVAESIFSEASIVIHWYCLTGHQEEGMKACV